ncbi:M56 family metallopeptidase [Rhodothermus profundi]|uniref:Outer membrane transport energization protein TonB n=1 Tax=Rhodothermus profundi TaxID=633813 RepID=A0A1M6VZC7_9BACT|nr:M56 family metallopeptidase [Rhodothermus profundi]SHK86797.1 outer membrane transport energization protein TonB [Rhodothermus profundi]
MMRLELWWMEGAWLLLLWTVPALLLLLSAWRILRRWPEAAYALLQAGFYALPLGLLAYGLRLVWLPEGALWQAEPPAALAWISAQVVQGVGGVGESQGLAGIGWALGSIWIGGVVLRLVALGGRWVRLRRYLRACRMAPPALQAEVAEIARRLGIRRTVRLLVGGRVPFSLGGGRPTVVVPELALADPRARQPILWHELVHLRRRDFLAHLFEEGMLTLFWFHPLLWGYRYHLALLREVLCDRAVLAQRIASPAGYARLLLDVLLQAQRAPHLGLSLLKRSTLKTRMEVMMQHTPSLAPRVLRLLLVGALLGLTGLMACSEMPNTPMQPEQEQLPALSKQAGEAEEGVFVVVEEMPRLIGGFNRLVECLRYPEEAKAAGVEGRVIIRFVVDEQGNVANPKVLKGVGAGLDEEALRCVRQLKFTPGRQQGRPVPVRMTLPVVFRLDDADSEQAQN